MIDISSKGEELRYAKAAGRIFLLPATIRLIMEHRVEKGDVLEVARVSAMLAAKRTPEIIPHCHPIELTNVNVGFEVEEDHIDAWVEVKSFSRTGAEMEALCGVCAALLTIWDMVKGLEKDGSGNYPHTRITDVRVIEKRKVKSRESI